MQITPSKHNKWDEILTIDVRRKERSRKKISRKSSIRCKSMLWVISVDPCWFVTHPCWPLLICVRSATTECPPSTASSLQVIWIWGFRIWICYYCLIFRTPAARATSRTCYHLTPWLDWCYLHHVLVLLFLCAPCGSPMTLPRFLGSLSPSLLAFIICRHWSIGMNFSLYLDRIPSVIMSHPTPAYHEPRDIKSTQYC